MERKTILLATSAFIYYAYSILNIYLSVILFKQGYKTYFIVICVLFGIDKLITFISISKKCLLYLLLDTLQLGFLYIIIYKRLPFSTNSAIAACIYVRILPLLITQIIIFFGLKYLQKKQIHNSTKVIAYVLFLMSILFIVMLRVQQKIKEYGYQNIRNILSCMANYLISIFSYYISIATLIQLNDSQGNNIGCCYLAVMLFNLIFYCIYSPPFELIIHAIRYIIDQFIVCAFFNICTHKEITKNKLMVNQTPLYKSSMIIYYLNALIRLILMLIFGIRFEKQIIHEQKHKRTSEMINQINCLLSLILTALYLLYYTPHVYNFLFKVKVYYLKTLSDIQKMIKMLRKRNQELFILYYQIDNSFLYSQNVKPISQLLNNEFCSERCSLLYNIQVELSNRLKKGLIVSSNQMQHLCHCFCYKVIEEIEDVQECFIQNIQHDIESAKIHPLFPLYSRYQQGFLFDNLTLELERKYSQQLQATANLKIKSEILQILIFDKVIKSEMFILPSQILYDIYG